MLPPCSIHEMRGSRKKSCDGQANKRNNAKTIVLTWYHRWLDYSAAETSSSYVCTRGTRWPRSARSGRLWRWERRRWFRSSAWARCPPAAEQSCPLWSGARCCSRRWRPSRWGRAAWRCRWRRCCCPEARPCTWSCGTRQWCGRFSWSRFPALLWSRRRLRLARTSSTGVPETLRWRHSESETLN